jgi:hypothetical protein
VCGGGICFLLERERRNKFVGVVLQAVLEDAMVLGNL